MRLDLDLLHRRLSVAADRGVSHSRPPLVHPRTNARILAPAGSKWEGPKVTIGGAFGPYRNTKQRRHGAQRRGCGSARSFQTSRRAPQNERRGWTEGLTKQRLARSEPTWTVTGADWERLVPGGRMFAAPLM